jgi:uncharacterized caspase-like protein
MSILIPKNRESAFGKNYLLMIGIDEYLHEARLYNCVKDVKCVAEVLTTRFQFNPEDLFLLLNENASKRNIYKQLIELIDILQENDSIVIYYAGHGFYKENLNEGYLVPYDASASYIDTCIELSMFSKFINTFKAKHILFISDSDSAFNLIKHGNIL